MSPYYVMSCHHVSSCVLSVARVRSSPITPGSFEESPPLRVDLRTLIHPQSVPLPTQSGSPVVHVSVPMSSLTDELPIV